MDIPRTRRASGPARMRTFAAIGVGAAIGYAAYPGGAWRRRWRSNAEINLEDLRALRSHSIWSCLPLIYLKYLFKIWGFVFRR